MSQYVQDLLLGGVIALMTWPPDASGLAREMFLVERSLLYEIIMLKHELYATSRWRSRSSA